MKIRILACIQAAVLILSSFQTSAAMISTDDPVVETEVETETENETEDMTEMESKAEEESEIETGGGYSEEADADNEVKEEIPSETETENKIKVEAGSESETETKTTENEDDTVTVIEKVELTGVYQFGGAPSREDTGISVYSARAEVDTAELEEYLYRQMMDRNTAIDVKRFNIVWETGAEQPSENADKIVRGVLNEHPELYFVDSKIGYSAIGTSEDNLFVDKIAVTYMDNFDDAAFQTAVRDALAVVKSDMNDLEKAIVLHDYLAVNCEYDKENYDKNSVPMVSHSAYGALVNRIAVCDGYALAYKYLLNQLDINCYMVKSEEINHAWNLIQLGGNYYQVDVTWDDPTWDLIGRARHQYMFRSDGAFDPEDAIQKHSGGYVTKGSEVVDYRATDTSYDNAFWVNSDSPLVLVGNDCYYTDYEDGTLYEAGKGVIKRITLSDNNVMGTGEKILEIGTWTVWNNGSSYYQSAYSGLFQANNQLYYNDKSAIYSIAFDDIGSDTIEPTRAFTADTTNGYIYGSAFCQGKVLYCMAQNPNAISKENVETANLSLGVSVENIKLDKSTVTLKKGETVKLKATVIPTYATDAAVTWLSSDIDIATVGNDGMVTAAASGTCTITATADGKTAECAVTVLEPESETGTGSEPGTEQETGSEPGTEPETGSEPETEQETGSEPGTEQETGSGPGTEPETGSEPGTEQETGSGLGTEPETGSEPGTEQETGSEPGTEQETGSEPGTEQETGSEPETEPETGSEPETENNHTGKPQITNANVLFPKLKDPNAAYSAVYTGEQIRPVMSVSYQYTDDKGKTKTQKLKLNVDYTVSYSNNMNAGENTAQVTVRGIGEYAGIVSKKFTITQKDISKVTLSPVGDIVYSETPSPSVTVMDGAKELIKDRDYTIKLSTNGSKDADTESILTVEGKGNYTGTSKKSVKFNILKKGTNILSIASETIQVEFKNPEKKYIYNGKAQKPGIIVTDKTTGKKLSSSMYKVIYRNNINAGEKTAEAYVVGVSKNGKGYYGRSASLFFSIEQKDLKKVSASLKGTIPKTGSINEVKKAISEALVVKDGKHILSEAEYTVDYGELVDFQTADSIKAGQKYQITLKPKEGGNYKKDTEKTVQIKFGQLNLGSKTAIVSLTITSVEEKKVTLKYNGETLKPDVDYTVISIKQDRKTELYTVKVKAVKDSAYKGSRTFKEIPFKALSMTLDQALITGETGQTVQLKPVIPSDVQVSTITWESSNQSVAAVTGEGTVGLVGSGMAVITAKASVIAEKEQLELTAQCQVAVKGKMEDGEWVDVTDYGAVPDDGADDWSAFQGALESKGHAVYVPAGTYDIDLEKHNGIVMRKDYKLYMHKDAVLRAMKTDKEDCQIINVGSSGHLGDPDYYSNIEISGGTIVGELQAAGKAGEGVMGIRVQYARNIYIHDVTIKECRGDGIYVGGNGKGSANICITGCTIEDSSRNCLGIVNAHNLYVDNCKISGAGSLFGGKAPRACILIETNKGDDICTDIVIKNSTIDNKAVCSSHSEAYAFGAAWVNYPKAPVIQGDRMTVENCTFRGKVANYSVTNAKFINCTFDGEKIFKQGTVVQ